ncbi:MAG: ABC transporter permease [Anaerolineae bacterium]|nr:ABC transporter permease [Anaerolineae bacterium]
MVRRWLRGFLNSYYVRQIGKALFTIFFVTSLIFFLVRLMPINPIEKYVQDLVINEGRSREEALNEARAIFAIDLDAPMYVQYYEYVSKLVRGDLGMSLLSRGTPVSAIIKTVLPWTLFSVGVGLTISFIFGVLLGTIIAYRRNSAVDPIISGLSSLLSAIPGYLQAVLIIVFLGVQLKIDGKPLVPITQMRGAYTPGIKPGFSLAFIKDALFHAALPISVYILTTIGGWILSMKSNTINTLGEDYVTVARARGLSDRRITSAYVGRNALLPLVSGLAISIGFAFGGSTLIETYFVYPGIGGRLGAAVTNRDYPVMQGIFLMITFVVIFSNLLADMLYSFLDPRIRVGARGE